MLTTRLGNVDQKKTNIFHQKSGENSGKTFTAVKGRFLQTFFLYVLMDVVFLFSHLSPGDFFCFSLSNLAMDLSWSLRNPVAASLPCVGLNLRFPHPNLLLIMTLLDHICSQETRQIEPLILDPNCFHNVSHAKK